MKDGSKYIIYDIEPLRSLLRIPGLLLSIAISIVIMFQFKKAFNFDPGYIYIIILGVFFLPISLGIDYLQFKYLLSTKIEAYIHNEIVEFHFPRDKKKTTPVTINIENIDRLKTKFLFLTYDTHFQIFYDNDKVFPISRHVTSYVLKDDLRKFKNDLQIEINKTAANMRYN